MESIDSSIIPAQRAETTAAENLRITVDKRVLVRPVENTPKGPLFLSSMDLAIIFPVETLYFYRGKVGVSTDDLIEKMENALKRLLVHYYFIAGRLRWNGEEARLELDCNDAGILFAGASSELTIDEIGDINRPNINFTSLIVRCFPSDVASLAELPLTTVQVTRFKCGGFVLGLSTNHILFDGTAAAEFLINFASIFRGEGLVITPKPDRTSLRARSPPQIHYDHPALIPLPFPKEFSEQLILQLACYAGEPSDKHVYKIFPVTKEMLSGLKELGGGNCTSFEALTAHVWKCRTLALEMESNEISSVSFAVDIRKHINPPLPTGFSGIAVMVACARLESGLVVNSALPQLVEKVQAAKAICKEEDYIRSALDFLEVNRAITLSSPGGFTITSWWRIPFHHANFGWGQPAYAGPVTSSIVEFVLFLYNGTPDSLNVYVALEPDQMARFEEQFYAEEREKQLCAAAKGRNSSV